MSYHSVYLEILQKGSPLSEIQTRISFMSVHLTDFSLNCELCFSVNYLLKPYYRGCGSGYVNVIADSNEVSTVSR